ncbi:MAG: HAMP domain-containing sensor histidine kinase [Cyanobacteria bacterium P01_E01_bin.6]
MVQSHRDITQSTALSESTGIKPAALAAQLKQAAAALNAETLALIHWDAKADRVVCRASFPEKLPNFSRTELMFLSRAFRAEGNEQATNSIRPLSRFLPSTVSTHSGQSHLAHEGSLLTEPCLRSSFSPSPTHLYGCFIAEQAPDFDYLLVEMPQPLTSHEISWLGVCISALKQHVLMEQDIQRQHAKIALLEQVIQYTSHQARQPLALIELYADVLLDAPVEENVRSHLTQLHGAATDLEHHIHQLADCGLHNKLNLDHHSLRSMWAESVDRVHPWLEEKQIHVANPSHPAELWCDRWQVEQVFSNLLHNAIHFSPVGGTITCHWQRFQEEVLIEISDEGPGIPDQDLHNVFTPFYSHRQGGTGIGLAVVRKIVLDHQGRCWVQNLPNGGAKFSFTMTC